MEVGGIAPNLEKCSRVGRNSELFRQLAFFILSLQAHIVLPLQAYRCLYPLEKNWRKNNCGEKLGTDGTFTNFHCRKNGKNVRMSPSVRDQKS
jgi:hypothetical protein